MKTKILAIAILSITLLPASNIAAQEKVESTEQAKGWAITVIEDGQRVTVPVVDQEEADIALEELRAEGFAAYRTFIK